MTSLRTIWGCDLVWVKQKYGEQNAENLMNNALPFLESDQMIYQKGKLLLTPAGRLFTDGIASSLFTDSD
jgi:oxygen-independent coproporphyrinogen-3 oxidase